MKKIIFHLLFFLFLSNPLAAQKEFAPAGAEWCYRYLNSDDEVEAYFGLKLVRDTFVDPWAAKLMQGRLVNVASLENLDRYNRSYLYFEERDSVFYIYGKDSPLFYLFNTRYAPGDTVLTYLLNSSFEVTHVDSISLAAEDIHIADIELVLEPHARLKIYGHLGPSTSFVEGWWTNELNDNTFELAAYRDDFIGNIEVIPESCFSFLDYVEPERLKPDTCALTIFPNPVEYPLQLKLDCNNVKTRTFELSISDVSGKIWQAEEVTFSETYELETLRLPTGQYFGVLRNEQEVYNFKFSKIH